MKKFKKFHFKFIAIILAFSLVTQTSYAQNTCEGLFTPKKTFVQRAAKFLTEFLIVRDAPEVPAPTKLLGFATEIQEAASPGRLAKIKYYVFDFIPNKLGHLITLDRNYRFTPVKAIDQVVDKPFGYVTKKTLNKKKELGLIPKLPLWIPLSIFGWFAFDSHVVAPIKEWRIESISEKRGPVYDYLIENDFRYEDIKNVKQADLRRVNAYHLTEFFDTYYENYSKENPYSLTLQENLNKFGTSPLFAHLGFFIENGVKNYEGTRIDPQYLGPMSDGQMKMLFDLTHILYAKYQIIDSIFIKDTNVQVLLNENAMARNLYNNGYTQELITLYVDHKITKKKLIYYLQEDAHNVYYQSIFITLHIENLQKVDGVYIDQPITINVLRNDRLEEIKEAKP